MRAEIEALVREALSTYRLHYTVEDDGGGLPLVDALTPSGDKTIARGQAEREVLADYIVAHLTARLAAIAQGVGEGGNTGTVADIPDAALVARALAHAIRRRKREPAWATVSNVFALGSTYAAQLCRRFNRDPETGAALTPQQDTPAKQEDGNAHLG